MFIQKQVDCCFRSLRFISSVVLITVILVVLLTSTSNAIELSSDCEADASATYVNLGTSSYTYEGNYSAADVKTFWKFSFPELAGAASGTYVRIDDAKLVLYGGNEGAQYTDLPTAKVYKVLDNNWSETSITISSCPEFSTILGRYNYPGYLNEISINCTDYVQEVLDSDATTISFGSQAPNNYVDTLNANRFRMCTREFVTSTYRPKLVINYTVINVDSVTIECESDASASYLNLGSSQYTYEGNYSGADVRTFWRFPLANVQAPIGNYTKICNAKLVLYGGNEGTQYNNLPLAEIYQVLDNDWSETNITISSCPEFGQALGSYDYPGFQNEISINCTEYMQSLLNENAVNISFGSEASNNYIDSANAYRFRMLSREYADSNYRPKLVVNYMIQPEIDPILAPVVTPQANSSTTPITHQQYFLGERELFGYAPLYIPGTITFDENNTPYIRVGENKDGHDVYYEDTKLGVIQTLNSNGRWIDLRNFTDAIQSKYPNWDGYYKAGILMDERIAFDSDGDAYMTVETYYSMGFNVLLHSTDKCQTWNVYGLPSTYARTRLEIPDSFNDLSNPPVITCMPYDSNSYYSGEQVDLICPEKNLDGTLTIPSPIAITPGDGYINPRLSNVSITKGNFTYITYPRTTAISGYTGTPQYIVVYDHINKTVSVPVLLGVSDNSAPDIHDAPSITIDSSGYLHVVLGTHHGNFQYTKSLAPYSITSGWTTPVQIGRLANSGGWTYVTLVCDNDNTLHVVGRYAGYLYRFGLWYLRKKNGEDWEDLGPLVMPFRNFYSNWDQTLTIDRNGRLFLNYMYYGNQYDHNKGNTNESDAYKNKWPWEDPYIYDTVNFYWNGVQGHSPCIIMSDDGGDTWRLMLTTDVIPGI